MNKALEEWLEQTKKYLPKKTKITDTHFKYMSKIEDLNKASSPKSTKESKDAARYDLGFDEFIKKLAEAAANRAKK